MGGGQELRLPHGSLLLTIITKLKKMTFEFQEILIELIITLHGFLVAHLGEES